MNLNDLKQMLALKKVTTQEEQEKKELINDLFTNDLIFFELKMETAISILKFIGIADDKLVDVYFSLISPENYQKLPKDYVTISKN